MRHTPRKLRLRPEAVRTLTPPELRGVAGGVVTATDAKASCDPCPGEYSWFCKP